MLSLAMPHAVELSTWMGVGGWGCPISWRVVRRMVASFMLVNKPAVSASDAEDTTTFITPVGVRMGPLTNVSFLLPRKKYPPALLRTFGSER